MNKLFFEMEKKYTDNIISFSYQKHQFDSAHENK